MKTRILPGWLFGMLLTAITAALGCAQESPNAPPKASSSDKAAQAAPASRSAPAAQVVPGKQGEIKLSPWSHEIQKLLQAGVDERVITTYITNSASIFNLTPDHIIYLKNVGASPRILNVMIQHDQQLFSSAGLLTAPTLPPAGAIATFPAPGESPVVAIDDSEAQEPLIPEDDYYAPEQPESLGPVRAPYGVKLNDPIIMLRVPSYSLPCW
jgi:hypothetical protein